MREQYEFLQISIHKSEKKASQWIVKAIDKDSEIISVPTGDLDEAKFLLLNKFGKEGWHLGSYPYNMRWFIIQRKI